MSVRFRRTRCGLSQTNLPRFDFPLLFQLSKRPAVICTLFTKATGGMFSIELRHDHKDAPARCLCSCEQLTTFGLHSDAQLHPPSRESEAGNAWTARTACTSRTPYVGNGAGLNSKSRVILRFELVRGHSANQMSCLIRGSFLLTFRQLVYFIAFRRRSLYRLAIVKPKLLRRSLCGKSHHLLKAFGAP
jgi:hypothetical protein